LTTSNAAASPNQPAAEPRESERILPGLGTGPAAGFASPRGAFLPLFPTTTAPRRIYSAPLCPEERNPPAIRRPPSLCLFFSLAFTPLLSWLPVLPTHAISSARSSLPFPCRASPSSDPPAAAPPTAAAPSRHGVPGTASRRIRLRRLWPLARPQALLLRPGAPTRGNPSIRSTSPHPARCCFRLRSRLALQPGGFVGCVLCK
jgi:hypothetical protein